MVKITKKEARNALLTKNPFRNDRKSRDRLYRKSLLECLFIDPGYMLWLVNNEDSDEKEKILFKRDIEIGIAILDAMPVVVMCNICNDAMATHYSFNHVFESDSLYGMYICGDCLTGYNITFNNMGSSLSLKIEALNYRFNSSEADIFVKRMKEYMGFAYVGLNEYDEKAYLDYILERSFFVKGSKSNKKKYSKPKTKKLKTDTDMPLFVVYEFQK